jgi:hypothetical protein
MKLLYVNEWKKMSMLIKTKSWRYQLIIRRHQFECVSLCMSSALHHHNNSILSIVDLFLFLHVNNYLLNIYYQPSQKVSMLGSHLKIRTSVLSFLFVCAYTQLPCYLNNYYCYLMSFIVVVVDDVVLERQRQCVSNTIMKYYFVKCKNYMSKKCHKLGK